MKQELILLIKQRSVLLLLAISLLLSYLSLLNGWENVHHIQAQISHAQLEESRQKQQQLAEYAHLGKIDAGEVGYYVFHHVYQHPSDWTFIALGNRLVTPYIQRIRLLGLQSQLYDGESHHPEYVMLGAFDYSFWLVFFSPLLCIALMHELKASEFQAQRLSFLNSLVSHPVSFWAKRLILRWLMMTSTLILPLIAFAISKSLPITGLLTVLLVTVVYTLFWSALCALVSLRRQALNASYNAMLLTSLWLLLCVILPNMAQLWVQQQHPLQEGSQIALQHRQLVHGAWDLPKEATLDPFYKLYPQWQHTPPVTGRFHWKWYYAFQHMADINLAKQVQQREQSLRARDQATKKLSDVLPSLWAQRQLEALAQSDIAHLLNYRQRITELHTQLRHTLYPYIFEESNMLLEDFADLPTFSPMMNIKHQ